jgi:hypothetical protein
LLRSFKKFSRCSQAYSSPRLCWAVAQMQSLELRSACSAQLSKAKIVASPMPQSDSQKRKEARLNCARSAHPTRGDHAQLAGASALISHAELDELTVRRCDLLTAGNHAAQSAEFQADSQLRTVTVQCRTSLNWLDRKSSSTRPKIVRPRGQPTQRRAASRKRIGAQCLLSDAVLITRGLTSRASMTRVQSKSASHTFGIQEPGSQGSAVVGRGRSPTSLQAKRWPAKGYVRLTQVADIGRCDGAAGHRRLRLSERAALARAARVRKLG